MSVTETRRATILILHVQIEKARFTFLTPFTFYVFFTNTSSRSCITMRFVSQASTNNTTTGFASFRPKVIEIILTAITFLSGDAWLTLAFSFTVTLLAPRPCKTIKIKYELILKPYLS